MAGKKVALEDLRSLKDQITKEKELRKGGHTVRITVHRGTCGLASGAQKVMDRALQERFRSGRSDIAVCSSGCIGLCSREPLVTLELMGREPIIYQRVDDQKMEQIFHQHVLEGNVQIDFALARDRAGNEEPVPSNSDLEGIIPHVSQLDFFALQHPWVLRNRGLIDPERIDDYIWRDGYLGAAQALLQMNPSEIVSEIKASGLRDRDAGGFPTGVRWELCAHSKGNFRYVFCNADEGDPGSFLNRSILETDPHAVLEGMIIGARAIGSHKGYIYCRSEYALAVKTIRLAIDQARDSGLLGKDILGSAFDFDIEVYQGPGGFVCTEETALAESNEKRRRVSWPRPSLPDLSEVRNQPTILGNVETYANIPQIILRGGETHAKIGTESSKGTKIFSLAGKVNHAGLVEVPLGTPLGEIIFDIGGGIPGGKRFKAVQLGGPQGGFIPGQFLNTRADYESIPTTGAVLGSGSMTVMDEDSCMVDGARYFMDFWEGESSAGCTTCWSGIKDILGILQRICRGEGREGDIELLESLAKRAGDSALCSLGQRMPNPVLSTLRYFRQEYEAHIRDHLCPAMVCPVLSKTPCRYACPAGTDIPAYVTLIRNGRIDDAYKILKQANPFPIVCSRVCSHPCEAKCRRIQYDRPIALRHLERFIADRAKKPKGEPFPLTRNEQVAIVGSGPSGLTAALELRRRGYAVTVFEELPEPGGMLRWGIPPFRLPRDEVKREIEEILRTGVDLRTHTRVGRDVSLDALARDFDMIYLAVGAQKTAPVHIPGEDAEGVIGAVEFLRNLNLGKPMGSGKHVAVIGEGNLAMDAARTAIRSGARRVAVYYRQERNDREVEEWKVKTAEEEGVRMVYLAAPVRIVTQYGRATHLELSHMRLDRFNPSGRRQPIPILGSEFREKAEVVISAAGRGADLDFLTGESGIETDGSIIKVGEDLRTTNPKVWAGGDVATGAASVINAIKAGQKAARAMDEAARFVKGEKPWIPPVGEVPDVTFEAEEEGIERPQVPMPEGEPEHRRRNFCGVEADYPPEMALAEAFRCMGCATRMKQPVPERGPKPLFKTSKGGNDGDPR